MTTTHRIAVIPGDGIGKEVVPEGVKVLNAAAEAHGFTLDLVDFDFASADYYLKHRATRKVVCAGQPSGWLIRRGSDPASMRGCVVVDQARGW